MQQTFVIFQNIDWNFAVILQNLFFRRRKNRRVMFQVFRQGAGMGFKVEPPIEHDAKKLLAGIQTITAEHAFATQAIEGGELLKDEITEGVGDHSFLAVSLNFTRADDVSEIHTQRIEVRLAALNLCPL